jgi:hypothetical protein
MKRRKNKVTAMFYRLSLLLAFSCSFLVSTKAQRTCGSYTPSPDELKQNPRLKFFFDSINTRYWQWLATRIEQPGVVRVLPIVVHVLYNNSLSDPTNISDAQIFSQIDIVNNDYRKLNGDWTKTPAVWQGLVADCDIKFCLASKDPNGNYTSGIIRKKTDSTNFALKPSPKYNNSGGDDPWPTEKYINVWIVPNLNNGTVNLLGYASFPWQNAGGEDGVVVRNNALGNIGTAATPYNRGRTLTHELGHFLGLKHIWGDDDVATDRCSGTDEIDDTPNQKLPTYGCSSFPLADSCNTNSPGIMFMNYMDYTNDTCMYMFTNDQKTRMDFYIATSGNRQALVNNVGYSCGNCDITLNLSGNSPVGTAFYKSDVINSTQTIPAGGTLIYKAGSIIRLLPGFTCSNGRILYAGIEVCYPSN